MSNDSPAPEPMLPPGATPEQVAEIDRRSATFRAAQHDQNAMDALWRAIYDLEHWLFIPRGQMDAPTPFAIHHDRGPLLLAFTTPDRARHAALLSGLPEDEAGMVLAVPMPGAVGWAASPAEGGVTGMVVDYGTLDLVAPIGNLVPMQRWFESGSVTGSPESDSTPGG